MLRLTHLGGLFSTFITTYTNTHEHSHTHLCQRSAPVLRNYCHGKPKIMTPRSTLLTMIFEWPLKHFVKDSCFFVFLFYTFMTTKNIRPAVKNPFELYVYVCIYTYIYIHTHTCIKLLRTNISKCLTFSVFNLYTSDAVIHN